MLAVPTTEYSSAPPRGKYGWKRGDGKDDANNALIANGWSHIHAPSFCRCLARANIAAFCVHHSALPDQRVTCPDRLKLQSAIAALDAGNLMFVIFVVVVKTCRR